jgi:hypothetical protein
MAMFVRRTPPPPVAPAAPMWFIPAMVREGDGRHQLLQEEVLDNLVRVAPSGTGGGNGDARDHAGDGAGSGAKPTTDDGTGQQPKQAAASSDQKTNSTPHALATLAAAIAFLIGLWLAVRAFATPDSGPSYRAADGIGAFALFYIVAQAAERGVELFLPYFEWVPGFGKARKTIERDQKVAVASDLALRTDRVRKLATDAKLAAEEDAAGPSPATPKTPEVEAADAQAVVDQLRANRTAVVFGLTAGLGMWLCGYLEADFLSSVGVTFAAEPGTGQQVLMMAVTGLIVGGGAKGIHDTMTNISKSSDSKSTPAETGGQK